MKVTWKEDLRPMPDQVPTEFEEACWDMSLIVDRSGEVVGQHRTIFGTWYLLVLCDDGILREVDTDKVKIIG